MVSIGARTIIQILGVATLAGFLTSAACAQGPASNIVDIKHCAHPQVLMAGGTLRTDGSAALPSAELYDVAGETFSSARAMILPRTGHTATTLRDGRVLLAGGEGPENVITATAEIYDPAAGTFSATGNMNVARAHHTATLLRDGTVLITGGAADGPTFASSAEIYDPKAGRFEVTGSMTSARENQTATLLKEGTVLITGGDNTTGVLQSAELYWPERHGFVEIKPKLPAPGAHEANYGGAPAIRLRNGTVLIVGESDPKACCPGGANKGAEIYHPWFQALRKTKSDMQEIRTGPSVTLLNDGTVLLAGGYPLEAELADAETYDPEMQTFTMTDNMMSSERGGHTATLLPNGAVLVAGGLAQGTQPGQIRDEFPQASADLYDPARRLFAATGTMLVPRAGHTASLVCAP